MNINNPRFNHVNRAAYELPWLLKDLSDAPQSNKRLILEAVKAHPNNASTVLMVGIEAIGNLLFSSAGNTEWPIEPEQLAVLDSLLTHLAVEVRYMQETQLTMQEQIQEDEELMQSASADKKVGGHRFRPRGRISNPE